MFWTFLDMYWTCVGHDWVMCGTEDVILLCNIFWHIFLKLIIFYLVAKANFGRNLVVLGEIIIYFPYSVANFLISGWG